MYALVIVVLAVAAGCNGQFLNCGWVRTLDCARYTGTPECGTDGNTYNTRCDFAKAQCKNKDLHIYVDGTCQSAGITPKPTPPKLTSAATTTSRPATTAPVIKVTTPSGPTTTRAPIFLGHNAVLDFFCLELSHEQCPTDTEQVCGTDGKTYANFCEYEKARCTHRTLNVANYGSC